MVNRFGTGGLGSFLTFYLFSIHLKWHGHWGRRGEYVAYGYASAAF